MAKQPETIDRFRVWAEVPKDQLGDVVIAFTKMGLQQIGHEMITDMLNFKKRQRHEVTGADFLREWIKDHPTFTRKEAAAAFVAAGRADGAAFSALQALRVSRDIKNLGGGNYQRKDVKAIAPPKKEKSAKAKIGLNKKTGKPLQRTPHKRRNYDVNNIDFLLNRVRERKSFTVKQLQDHFERNGRTAKSVSPLLTQLLAQHKIRRLSAGEYAVVKIKPTPRMSKQVNGAAGAATHAPETEVTTNG
jgi:hypothetical protein